MMPIAMVHRYVLLLPAFLAAAALHRCGLAPWRIGTEDSLQAFDDAIEELTRQLRLAVAAASKTVLCKVVHRYVRERRLQPRVEHIHGSELVSAVGLPELRAACKEWLIGQRIIVLADEMCAVFSTKALILDVLQGRWSLGDNFSMDWTYGVRPFCRIT
jgi:hypothetical protein